MAVTRLDDLPVGGIGQIRNFLSETQLLPGASFTGGAASAGGTVANVRIDGAPNATQNMRIEGQDAGFPLGATFATWAQPSTDAIQEVAIQTSNYAAEFGQAGGGVFNLTMRSGTNQFHGSAYEYWSNEALNAGQPFTNNGSGGLIRTRTRKNDWGLTGGGPIWIPKVYDGRNKTFFFFAWENLPSSSINSTTFNEVPTVAYRNGDFSGAITAANSRNLGTDPLGSPIFHNAIYDPKTQRPVSATDPRLIRDQFPGNLIPPTSIDPVAAKVQALVPLPNLPGLISNEVNPFAVSSRYWIPSLKLDQQLSARQKLSFFWSLTRTASPYSAGAPIGGGAEGFPLPVSEADSNSYSSHRFTLNYDYSITPTMLLHLGMGYMDSWLTMPSHTTDYNATTQLGLTGPFIPYAFPNFLTMTSAQGGLKNLGNIFTGSQNTGLEKPTGVASVTWVKNNHTFKFGGEMRIEGYPNYNFLGTNGTYSFSANETALPYLNSATVPGTGATIGFPYASFLLGLVDTGNVKVPAVAKMGKSQFGFFAQDTWKVTRKLTLDYGLRYDYSTYPKEQYGRIPTLSPTTPDPSAGNRLGAAIYEANCNCSFAKNYPLAFGPRLGVAYQITSKTVLRAGAGIVYNSTADNGILTRSVTSSNPFTSPSFGQPAMVLAQGVPLTASQIAWPNFSPGYYPLPGLQGPPFVFDQNAGRPARQYQWSIGVQREVVRNLLVEAAYVGNRGIWWQANGLVNYNAPNPATLTALGLNLNSATDLALLNSPMSSATVAARGFTVPYAGFPVTSTLAQALRPFPQYASGLAPTYAPLGDTWYNSLQVKATKRLSHGIDFTYAFTWQKTEDLGADGSPANNVFNRPVSKDLSASDQPLVSVIAANYTVPKWANKGFVSNKILSYVMRDWQLGGIFTYASGLPIQAPAGQNNLSAALFQTTFSSRVPGVPLFTQDLNCHCFDPNKTFVLNPAAWKDPAPGTFGTAAAYYTDYRQQRRPAEAMNFGRLFRITEKTSLQIRAEFTNVFNRTEAPSPTSTNALATQTTNAAGQTTAGFGFINLATVAAPARTGQLVARFRF